MKYGIRRPSIKRSIKARTTRKLKRALKKALIPRYGEKGTGWIKNPKKAIYNKIYNETTFKAIPSAFGVRMSSGTKAQETDAHAYAAEKQIPAYNEYADNNGYIKENNFTQMKVCKYCGQESPDDAMECGSCGAREFSHRCVNCGRVFDGNFCPGCGVKLGATQKFCTRCGEAYYTKTCPNCGYDPSSEYINNNTSQKPAKRKTWLWVLGWIFIFPVPLTILMIKNKKMPLWARIVIIILGWLVYFGIAYSGDREKKEPIPTEESVSMIVILESNL